MTPTSISFNAVPWIWIREYNDYEQEAKFMLFRKSFELSEVPSTPCIARVSADTRYRLLVNGERAAFGPCKSYLSRWYYEEVDIRPFLRSGTNVISARVLRFSPAHLGNSSMIRGPLPGFVLQCAVDEQILDTNKSWRVFEDKSTSIIPRSEWNYALGPPFLSLSERCDQRQAQADWTDINFDDSSWEFAVTVSMKTMMMPVLEPRKLFPRPIPSLPEIPGRFTKALKCHGDVKLEQWNAFVCEGQPVRIDAGQKETVDIEFQKLTTGFLRLVSESGAAAKVTILCAESYEKQHQGYNQIGTNRWKGDRRDFCNSELYGPVDELVTAVGRNTYEPFWFRTFRFVRLTVEAGAEPLNLVSFDLRQTHYPLEIKTQIQASPLLEDLWQISINTLQNCMHETFEDCPFYEQNQFAMDTRIQILFSYQLSRDDRLARKCIHEFYASRREDGLVETHFPVPFRSINIPQFSLFWILMLCDHYEYFGDSELVRRYLGTADGVLNHFHERLEGRGFVGRFDDETWPFVDWVKEWHGKGGLKTMAIPPCYYQGDGVVTYNSLVYSYVLQQAAMLNSLVGRTDTAKEYLERAQRLNEAVNKHCWDGEMYVDGPSTKARSQHAQIFAVLAGAITDSAAKELMNRTLTYDLPKCSYAMSFYVLRAVSQVGLYEEHFERLVQPWVKMMQSNLTTWAEDDVMFRSDCHGWSSSPIYEIVHEIFGLRPAAQGYEEISVGPKFRLLPEAKGRFVTGRGIVNIEWKDGVMTLMPSHGLKLNVVLEDKGASYSIEANEELKVEYS